MHTYNNKYQTVNKVPESKSNDLKTNLKYTKTMIYNSKSKKLLERNKIDWVRFLAFFFICLISMILLLIGMFFIFTEGVINEDVPLRTGLNSLLKNTPSLSFRPLIDFKTALIRYADADPSTYMLYIQSLRTLVQTYEDSDLISEDSYATCIGNEKIPNDITKPCRFNIIQLDRCIKQYNFGYDRTKPCILVKINRIYGWVPDIANSSMSKDILIKCAGQNQEDVENFSKVRYYPNVTVGGVVYGYLSSLYYPYLVQYGYRQPLLGVEFDKPKKNVLLMATCNIVNLVTKSDPLTFEILID